MSEPNPTNGTVTNMDNEAATSSPTGSDAIHYESANPAIVKDACQGDEEEDDDPGPSSKRPNGADVEEKEDEEEDKEEDEEEDEEDEEEEESHNNARTEDLTSPRNLWEKAWNSDEVGDKRRAILMGKKQDQKPVQTDSQKLVDDVVNNTRDKMARYKARWGSDHEKSTLNNARTILLSALKVKDMIDAGLKFDPTGYGAAAWTVVSFSLTVWKFLAVFVDSMRWSVLIRYILVDTIRQGTDGPDFRGLQLLG